MTFSKKSCYEKLGLGICLTICGVFGEAISQTFILKSNYALAEVTPDSTLPNNSRVKVEGNKSIIEGGTTRNSNLFHSFEEFSVKTGSEAHFNNASGIENIISRVTGKSISDIDGLIKANGNANLFLINPNGIVFGKNASLDIGGSFVGSTANSLKFADGKEFSASEPQTTGLLSINIPLGLQYGSNSGKIRNLSQATNSEGATVGLQVKPGKTLGLIGGDVSFEGGRADAAGARVELGGLKGAGTIGLSVDGNNLNNLSFDFPVGVERSDISLTNESQVDVTSDRDGTIAINSRNFELTQNSSLTAGIREGLGSINTKAGNIEINATRVIDLKDGSIISNLVNSGTTAQGGDINLKTGNLLVKSGASIYTNILGGGKGGNLTIDANDVQIIDTSKDGQSFSELSTRTDSTGDGGDLTIKTNTLLVQDGAEVSTSIFGEGKGGNLTIDAKDIQLSGSFSYLSAEAFSESGGDGGDLKINTNTLLVQDGAAISSSTYGEGKGGNLTIDAQDIKLIGTNKHDDNDLLTPTGLFSNPISIDDPQKQKGEGDGGDLSIKTNTLLVQDGAEVSTSTFGKGKGGNLTIDAQDIKLIGTSKDALFPSGLFSSASFDSTGNAGNLELNTNTLLVKDGAQVSTGTFAAGNGGKLTVNAQDVQLIGRSFDGKNPSSLRARANRDSTGNAGNLELNTNTLLVKDGAQVSTGTFAAGNGGKLTVNAQDVQLIGRSKDNKGPSGLRTRANSGSTGNAGDLDLTTNTLLVKDGAQVSTDTSAAGKGGQLTIHAQDVQLIGRSFDGKGPSSLRSRANTGSTGNAGNLDLTTNTLLAKDGAQVSTDTSGEGHGGELTIDAQDVQLIGRSFDGKGPSSLRSRANSGSTGNAGNLDLTTNTLLAKDGAQVSTGSSGTGKAGDLTIDAQDVQLIGKSKNGKGVSGLFARADPNSTMDAGDLSVNTGRLLVSDGAAISAQNFGKGVAGDLKIDADSVQLDNGNILADTNSTNGGNIRLKIADLLLTRNGSRISTSVNNGGAGGNGGNIDIDAPNGFIVSTPNQNNDITANAFDGDGGNVSVNTAGIFGMITRSREDLVKLLGTDDPSKLDPGRLETNSITAISQQNPNLSGAVKIDVTNNDSNRESINLPVEVSEPELVSGCQTSGSENQSRFVVTGRGGLPVNPKKSFNSNTPQVDWVTPSGRSKNPDRKIVVKKSTPKVETIVEATDWLKNAKGEIVLVANPGTKSAIAKQAMRSCSDG